MENMLREAQISITKAIQEIVGEDKFKEDSWVCNNGGGDHSDVLVGGKVWERGGANLSEVHGTMPVSALQAATECGVSRGKGDEISFFACELSCLLHPHNPHRPTVHFNYCYFKTDSGDKWWFGGGMDITPCYIEEEDMKQFHGTYKAVCDRHDPEYYAKFKDWADRYFFIKHPGERRGLGGVFLNNLNDQESEDTFEFCKDAVNHVVPAYGPIIERRKNGPFTEEQKQW
jgi:coproporphyrinogen III oxidase